MKRPTRTLALAIAATGVLTACGASPPPARQLATELVATLDVGDEVKACMVQEIEAYGEAELDEIAELADVGDVRGLEDLEKFQRTLAACNG